MSGSGSGSGSEEATVAVAVGHNDSRGSRRAARWAVENLMPCARRFLLVHVAPPVTFIPTPLGNHIPIKQVPNEVVDMYIQDMKLTFEKKFLPFKKLSKTREMETLVLYDDNPAAALLRCILELGITSLVLGSSSLNYVARKLKGPDMPSTVLKLAPNTCNVYIVSQHKISKKLANLLIDGRSATSEMHNSNDLHEMVSCREVSRQICGSYSNMESKDFPTYTDGKSQASSLRSSSRKEYQKGNHYDLENMTLEIQLCKESDVAATFEDASSILQGTKQAAVEVEKLRGELEKTLTMYSKTCEDLVYARSKAQLLFAECLDDSRRVKDALEREEMCIKIATEENARHLEATKEIEAASQSLAKEVHERQKAEKNALKESFERKRIVDAVLSADRRYRRFTRDEIEGATDNFSEAKKIGEGGYGKVYKGSLDHTPVAIKVLQQDAYDKKEEFLKEVEVLSQLRHPHMVLLLGACPESGSLVYEYMENGSLEDRLFCCKDTASLPWFIRFRVVYEVACGLAFLHGSKPEPIVHRDLKPGNILLDHNYLTKIGDVGMARLMSDIVPDSITEYRQTVLAGTFYYMDPEYQRTGTVRPKSDLYAFGVIILQLLTGKHPQGLLLSVEDAIRSDSFADVLDKSITDWPLADSEKLARVALKCCRLRCRDRPDLESEVMPELEGLLNVTDARFRLWCRNFNAPSHFFCPILQEVMDDPYIAADGFTYEYRAIKAWLERQSISPVSKCRFLHNNLTPNHSLRSAIEEWKSQLKISNS